MRLPLLFLVVIFMASCGEDQVVKPSALLRLDYQPPAYKQIATNCPFTFDKNVNARLEQKENCWMNVHYPAMNATIYLSYRPVTGANLDSLLYDAQKLTYDHTIKAEAILEQPRVDPLNRVYGMFYMINGNAATQSQFYLTDSIRHFITGSLYFESKPNFDSLYPAVVYLRSDIRRLMETITWRE
jgi:gliding motility-associated lipoprotein GldD